MNSKWYLSILVIALAFFGKSLEQKNAPNQEIVVQFGNKIISPTETQDALEKLQKQLQAIGAQQIQATYIEGNSLKVTYFSAIDIAIVKALFYEQESLILDGVAFTNQGKKESSNTPVDTSFSTYQLNVSEIPDNSQQKLGLNGVLVEVKFVRDHYVNPFLYFGASENGFSLKKPIEKLTSNLHNSSAIIIDNASYKIPEVRAGPHS